ncbi:hypothetical protein G5I_14483 [Acromyrmex echinatior]|uniref:Uncharacterized protein n=1 Tax=Acromyrmex echinatior TaxID=103372 RepID=F4X7Z9_ACREC|nr:hypothetical protein G5I_14483 [Acromyrmex echinatior]
MHRISTSDPYPLAWVEHGKNSSTNMTEGAAAVLGDDDVTGDTHFLVYFSELLENSRIGSGGGRERKKQKGNLVVLVNRSSCRVRGQSQSLDD